MNKDMMAYFSVLFHPFASISWWMPIAIYQCLLRCCHLQLNASMIQLDSRVSNFCFGNRLIRNENSLRGFISIVSQAGFILTRWDWIVAEKKIIRVIVGAYTVDDLDVVELIVVRSFFFFLDFNLRITWNTQKRQLIKTIRMSQ